VTWVQDQLWPEGWEAEADARNGTWRKRPPRAQVIPADHGRPCTRRYTPIHRPIVNVLRSL
jgi:hypothetical protein